MEHQTDPATFDEPRHILSLPYADRQLLMVVADHVSQLQRKTERGLIGLSEDAWKKDYTDSRLAELQQELEDPSRQAAHATATHPTGVAALVDACRTLKKARENQLDVLVISKSEAQQLHFPIGHPRYRVMYVGHPGSGSSFYVPMANFHRVMFEQKVAEAQRLLVALGATAIEVEHFSGSESATEANVGTGDVGFKGGKNSDQRRRVSSKMKMQPHEDPEIPKDLVWYKGEPLWQEVANARLHAGLESFELDIQYTDDFGVNASLSAKVNKIGIEVGGSFSRQQQETWRLRGTFGPVATDDHVAA